MPKWIGRIICHFKGHLRGRRLKPTDPPHVPGDQDMTRFVCPRCGAQWARKVSQGKRKQPNQEAI